MSWRVPLAQPIYTIFGANTGVGKTIVSTLLVRSFAPAPVSYIKPVSTGPLTEADYGHVGRFTGVEGSFFYQFDEPCSPHLAAGPDPPRDSVILRKLAQQLSKTTDGPSFVETAGGVHSPAPSGSSQLELYRPLRMPVVLVADSALGGISTTVSAYESLKLHGFDVAAIVGFKADWGNLPYLASKLPVKTVQLPPPPARKDNAEEDAENMAVYYDLVSTSTVVQALRRELMDVHGRRVERLREMPQQALDTFWYPFTQHSHLTAGGVTTIDSALGDDFATFDASDTALRPVFDGSASWWTQGLGHGNSELALTAAYAASRYGHVILPNAVNEPALALAENLVATVGQGWASRVYYSDNGATGIEVALKMALKASRVRYGVDADKGDLKLGIIGLTGSYHGDTIGAMDASDPNIYNDEVDWYEGRGLFFDPPSLLLIEGRWRLSLPAQSNQAALELGTVETELLFDSLADVFDLEARKQSPTAALYEAWITRRIGDAVSRGQKFGALLFEPLLLGAGGMVFVDPLFQHLLVTVVRASRDLCPAAAAAAIDPAITGGQPESGSEFVEEEWTGLPVITDEVFTGLYRLSHRRAFDLLSFTPDISVNAKLLTGGAVPLATTLASESIFRVFWRSEKKDALLHGHSYTAHPVGTSVALHSLAQLDAIYQSPPTTSSSSSSSGGDPPSPSAMASAAGLPGVVETETILCARGTARDARRDWHDSPLPSIWRRSFIHDLSHHKAVRGVICLGSVMAVTLVDHWATRSGRGKSGYGSTVSADLVARLRGPRADATKGEDDGDGGGGGGEGANTGRGVMVRPLGDVVYIMASQITSRETADDVAAALSAALDRQLDSLSILE